jgi:hypothetical protein
MNNRDLADEDDDGDHGIADGALQSYTLPDDALEVFNPYSDVFSASAVSQPEAQAQESFHNSMLEDAWTENENSRNLFDYLLDEDPLWWERNMVPDFLLGTKGVAHTLPIEEAARATVPRTADDKGLPPVTIEQGAPAEIHNKERLGVPLEFEKHNSAEPESRLPSLSISFNTDLKRRRGSQDSNRGIKGKKVRASACPISSMISRDVLLSQSLYQVPAEHPHHQGPAMSDYFPAGSRHGNSTSAVKHKGAKSAYPDPSLYTQAPIRIDTDQPHAGFQPLQVNDYSPNVWTDPPRQQAQFLSNGDGARQLRRPTTRRQHEINPIVEEIDEKRKIEWPGQRPPDLTNLSSWPPPFPDMNQPGPGGPGTWPSDWIELDSGRTQMKYCRFERGTMRIPGRHPLQTYVYWFPNHVRDAVLDHFRAAGWTGRKIWDHYHPDAVEKCREDQEKKQRGVAERPWNFLQQWFSRRMKEVKKGKARASTEEVASQSDEFSLDDSSSDDEFEQAQHRLVHPRPNPRPKTRSMNQTETAGNSRLPGRPKVVPGSETSYFSIRADIAPGPSVSRSSLQAPDRSRPSQHAAAAPWWQGQLMNQIDRVRQLLQLTDPTFAQQTNQTQILAADTHLRRQFPGFARGVWLQVVQGSIEPRHDLHPMTALRDMYAKLRQIDPQLPLPDEQAFCDGMMKRYLEHVSGALCQEEEKLRGPLDASSFASPSVDLEAFQYPRGSLHGFHSADLTSATEDNWLLQQPISYPEAGLGHASSTLGPISPQDLDLVISSQVDNHLDFATRGPPQPVSAAYVADVKKARHGQQPIGVRRASSKEPK